MTGNSERDLRLTKTGERVRITVSVIACLAILAICIRAGSVYISLGDLLKVVVHHISGGDLPSTVEPMTDSIFWSIRFPRSLTAFLVGGALAVSGAVMQSLLQNPLASSYTLGVSSGASLGAALVIICSITLPVPPEAALPTAGFVMALLTVVVVLLLSSRIDRAVSNTTVILTGMIVSLFVTGIMNLLATMYSDHYKQLWMWMTGSFSARTWKHVAILAVVCLVSMVVIFALSRELDILSFGEEQARAIGVDAKRVKVILIIITTILTGVSVAFTGVIGFVDLAAPHVVRRVFGPANRVVIPMSFIYGGAFMALSDLIARTVISPREIPVGAVTALIGAPFFAYVFFKARRRA